jgi:RHS repeat-associated protein
MNFTLRTVMRRKPLLRFLLWIAMICAGSATVGNGQNSPNASPDSLGVGRHFSPQPTDQEISTARIFDEPLLPLGGEASAGENRALADALTRYTQRTNLDDFSSLTGFLAEFPQSAWRASLLLHLGTEYYNFGYYSRALDAWEEAWNQSEHVEDSKGKAQADRALGELARMYSKLGRMDELEQLLASTADRRLTGPATQLIHAAKLALWMMQTQPEVSFKCGPLALDQINSRNNPAKAGHPLILQSKSTTNGFSLSQVADLSSRIGMNYQMAFRSPGAPLIVPAVVHWSVGHYAAILERDGDRVLAKDYTFRGGVWMGITAIDSEASGYFLVPTGPLPSGWRTVDAQEAGKIWGRGYVDGGNPDGTSGYDPQTSQCSSTNGMTTYNMHAMLVSLSLADSPVGYTPPVGPAVFFTAHYHFLEANQPATFYYSNLGPKWTCNWIDYITDNPTSPNADVSRYVSGGGTVDFTGFVPATQSYANEVMSQAGLVKTSSSSYEMQMPDGSKKEYTQSDDSVGTTRRIFLTQVIDPAGNTVTLNYDSHLRITNIVDAIGQVTTLFYTNATYSNAITSVMDPFGRAAYFQYDASGLLIQITDVLGLTSQYTYETNDFVTALTTPYGTTTFATGVNNGVTWLKATDPLGESEYLEFNENPGIAMNDPSAVVPHGIAITDNYLIYRNSFYWDKKAFADGAGDVTKAKLYHWLHSLDTSEASRIPESEKAALENRVWYNYPGQNAFTYYQSGATMNKPCVMARVLDDGTTQISAYQYNAMGNVTNSIDPVGRNFTYVYSTNNVDLLQTIMTHNGKHELQSSITYNSQHLPLTATDAAGQTTTNTYNANGQILSTTDPKGEITTFSYDTNGYLLTITGPLQTTNDITSLTYDGFGRVLTVTDTEGYTLTFAYDAADRKTQITHPDGTSEQFVYSNLDLVALRDRLGRWTTNTYNADRQLVRTQDPLGRITTYDWCKCGALNGLTDPMGRTTTWDYDVESRPIAKHYVDGSTVTYIYENTTSRLHSRFDEKGQQTFYEYYSDNNLKRVSYPNATVATPTVTYTYDPDYNRVLTMQDGIGTTVYSYNPITAPPALGAGLLASVSGPLPNSLVTYQYDQLSRVANRAINGVAQLITYDVLGRPSAVTNALGAFQYTYDGATPRLASESYPNGQTNLYTYYNTIGDERLLQILHLKPNGSLLSGFGYAYNPVGQITAWTNQWDTLPTRVWKPTYDAADQLTNVASTGGILGVTNYAYAYDFAGNRLTSATNTAVNNSSYNALNQLVSSALPTNNVTYEWDAENRLTAINQGTNRSEFFYDGMGRRVQIIEMANGNIVSNNFYLWCGTRISEQRDSTGANVARRLFRQGESISATNYYYTRDHLGSVREAMDSNGNTATRYDYDPYGQQTVVQETQETTFAYTGDFIHAPSKLYLTLYRPLDVANGRWLGRDPLEEFAGINLYVYVHNNSINRIDEFGIYDFWDFSIDTLQALNGASDQLTFGVSKWARQRIGKDETTDYCSSAYKTAALAAQIYQLGSGIAGLSGAAKVIRAESQLNKIVNFSNNRFYGGRAGSWSVPTVLGWQASVSTGKIDFGFQLEGSAGETAKGFFDNDDCRCGSH